MNKDKINNPSILDRSKLPALFPTHRHEPEFWEQLGRVIATFGFLEEVLGKAIFAFTATRQYSTEEIDAAYQAWLPKLEKALSDQLYNLAEAYEKAVRDNSESTIKNIEDLVSDIKKTAKIRNVLCHGSWRTPNAEGKSIPHFVDRKNNVFKTPIDIAYLKQTQAEVAALSYSVIDTVTSMGWQFPGSNGPGNPIWSSHQ
ncbi:hypothetical protein [Stenotrophobium rhamnosiphilum]|uniref:Uncharacterized protein n=1 Tax=Stenotrophobium rhamnosiphilum TaxID=2029166 RepID=A0A2T5MI21_9GAMM|nr:hypothetical protein [Stenotrophobium rhamnosiphilum]PTU32243.1 hypothetical protein CJD38_06185 [Stenotrophobium rhamnosiphilum]